jgi:tetratricopeptide (TPR) repeat protein
MCTLATLVLVLSGCVTLGRPVQWPTGGWSEYTSDHFTLQTDLSPARAKRVIQLLELTRAAIITTAWPSAPFPTSTRLRTIVLADSAQFKRFFGPVFGGGYTGSTWNGEPLLVLKIQGTREVVPHELTHYLASHIYLRQPRWFSEGLAQFMESLEISKDARFAEFGHESALPFMKWQRARIYKLASVADVLHWERLDDRNPQKLQALYGVSWALVHWLYNVHPDAFGELQRLLATGTDPSLAWDVCCHELARGADDALGRYYDQGASHVMRILLPSAQSEVSARPLSSAEVHLLRAQLGVMGPHFHRPERSIQEDPALEVAAALKDEPDNVEALWSSLSGRGLQENLAQAQRSCDAHPDNARAWLWKGDVLGRMHPEDPEAEVALRKAIALAPGDPRAFNELGWSYVRQGRFVLAYSLGLRAVRLAPWNPSYVDTLAAALAGLHRCDEAARTQRRAIDLLPERTPRATFRDFQARLISYEKECEPASTGASPGEDEDASPAEER